MSRGEKNIIIVIAIYAFLKILTSIGIFILPEEEIEVTAIVAFLFYCFACQFLYLGKKWAKYLVMFLLYREVIFGAFKFIWLPSILAGKLVPFFWRMSYIGVLYLGTALFLTFNKDIKRFLSNHNSK